MGTPVTLVDEEGNLYTTGDPLFVSFPLDLFTDGGTGVNRRLRVDVGQTGFFAGHEFRLFYEFTASHVIKIVVPLNVILFGLDISLIEGQTRTETVIGGVEGGSFATPITSRPRNTMTTIPQPPYVSQLVFSTGGTLTGGTTIDVLVAKAASNSNFASSVGESAGDERGVAAGTYYFRTTVTGTTTAILKLRWEERP